MSPESPVGSQTRQVTAQPSAGTGPTGLAAQGRLPSNGTFPSVLIQDTSAYAASLSNCRGSLQRQTCRHPPLPCAPAAGPGLAQSFRIFPDTNRP